jgi:predicted NBD/HSP70 family sugar kinase
MDVKVLRRRCWRLWHLESHFSNIPPMPEPQPPGVRERNTQAVLAALREGRAASRADLALSTGLSKPTVSGALRSFESAGLVREYGRTTGRRGPSAALYELVPDAVLVLGIDIGARYVRAVLSDLDGEPVQEMTLPLARSHSDDVLDTAREIRRRIGVRIDRTELAVVGSPGVVDPATGRISAAPNIEDWEGVLAERVLSDALGLPVHVDNDVNLAALGERKSGAGRDAESFAYLSIGSGLGAGIVLHGRLHRGARGAAGEIGFLPVGAEPFDVSRRRHGGAMEERLSSRALVELGERLADITATSLTPPFDAESLLEAARTGDPLGRAVVSYTARETAICVAGLTAVADLELVLLGGGIGMNAELWLSDVRTATAALVPAPPQIRCATLGDRAVRVGAIAIALDIARDAVVRRLVRGDAATVVG